jgi:hypothetical protein
VIYNNLQTVLDITPQLQICKIKLLVCVHYLLWWQKFFTGRKNLVRRQTDLLHLTPVKIHDNRSVHSSVLMSALPTLTFCSDYNFFCQLLFHVNTIQSSLSISSVQCEGIHDNIMPHKLYVIREGVNFVIVRHTDSIQVVTNMCMPNGSSIWPMDIFDNF